MGSAPLTEQEISDPDFDQPPCPTRAKVIICCAPRTGSWLLCRAMIHHGIGIPHEYFNARHISLIGPRFGVEALADGRRLGSDDAARRAYIAALMDRRTANGIFAAKIHWGQYASYLDNADGVQLLQQAHIIHLYREDLLGQAISFHVSKETGRWGGDTTVSTRPAATPRFFDTDLIAEHLETLAEADMSWRLYFARNGLSPLSLSYERLRDDVDGAVRNMVGRFGLDVPSGRGDYAEEMPDDARDAQVPPRAEMRARFLLAYRGMKKMPHHAAAQENATDVAAIEREAAPPIPAAPSPAAHPPAVSVKSPSRRQTVCLAMIVKDEASVIERCLASARPLIDYWIIVDTGSTDGTQDIIRRCFRDVPGELHERPWVDFAHNRSEALTLARPHGDYTLMIDADDVFEIAPGFRLPRLVADSYMVLIRHMEKLYWRPQLVRNALPWRFEGVLHEFVSLEEHGRRVLPDERQVKRLNGVTIVMSEEGARRRTDPAVRFRRDAEVLEQALAVETDPFLAARYTFYLAQSLMDAGDKERAIEFYRRRAGQGLWDQEVFICLYRIARLMEDLAYPDDEVIAAYLEASRHGAGRERAEPLHGAARLCRNRQRWREGYDIARRAVNMRPPSEGLFLEGWIYEYGVLDELAVNAYWVGKYEECLRLCRRLLATAALPADQRPRIEANLKFAQDKLREKQDAAARS
jgi:LPS sulfotransferase NodH/glycosyltransferase involved in cell wall biosynthesis